MILAHTIVDHDDRLCIRLQAYCPLDPGVYTEFIRTERFPCRICNDIRYHPTPVNIRSVPVYGDIDESRISAMMTTILTIT